MPRLAFLADTYLCMRWKDALGASPTDALFPAYFDRLPLEERRKEYESAVSVIYECYREVLQSISRVDPLFLVHLGDMVTGEARYGMGHPAVQDLARGVVTDLRGIAEFRFCAGRHDLGYGPRGINPLSLQACRDLGPLYWSVPFQEFQCIGICTPLLDPCSTEAEQYVGPLRESQMDFLADTLREHPRDRWILCAHSPNVWGLDAVIGEHVKWLECFIVGDKHMPAIAKLLHCTSYAHRGAAAECLRKAVVCPSVAPLWNRGGKYLTATGREGRFVLTEHSVEYPLPLDRAVRDLPFSTPLSALRFMLTWHAKRLVRLSHDH